MPLLDLKTDLKSLKYGQDTPGGGNSREPYIKVDINKVDSGFNQFRLTKFDDGLIRGGVVGSLNASVVDTLRIGKFFIDFPKGPLFLAKQVGLQLSNPKLEHIDNLPTNRTGANRPTRGQGFFKNAANAITNAATSIGPFISNVANRIENAVGPTRIYNLGVNTLAQVPLNAIGGHIMRHGFLPTNDESKLYYSVVRRNNFQNNHNRLEEYANKFYLGGFSSGNKFDSQPILTQYISGPGSVYGIGNTVIKKSYDTITNNWDNIEQSKFLSSIYAGKNRDLVDLTIGKDFGVSNNTDSLFAPGKFTNLPDIKNSGSFFPNNIANQRDKSNPYKYEDAPNVSSYSKLGSNFVLLEDTLKKFSIFKLNSKTPSEYINSYSQNLGLYNTQVYFQIDNLIKNPLENTKQPNNQSSNQTSNPTNSEETGTTAKATKYTLKPQGEIKGDNTNRTWRKKDELQTILQKSYDRTKDLNITLSTVSDEKGTTNQLPSRFFGISRLDPGLKTTSQNATLYDNTVVPYEFVQPSLRKYSELVNAVNSTIAGKQTFGSADQNTPLFNTINSETLRKQNEDNNKLSSVGGITLRNVASTAFSTNPVPKNANGNAYITYNNGIQGDKPVVIRFNNWNAASREVRIGSGRKDSINLTPLFGGNSPEGDPYWMDDQVGTHNIRDLVKFRISSVLTDSFNSQNENGKVNTMVFRAYLTDLSDTVDATWNDVKYAGRGNKFYIYDGFTRKISISFKVAALSAEEMQPMYSKLNYLMGTLMPDYGNKVMRGPLIRMTVGNYFDAQLGLLNSLSYKLPADSPWEIAIDEPEGGKKMLILPHILEVTLGFTPIGAETQGKNEIESKNRVTTFIAQNNTGTDKNDIQYYDYFNNKTLQ